MRNNPIRIAWQLLCNVPDTLQDILLVASWDIVRQARRPSFFAARLLIALVISFQFIYMWQNSLSNLDRNQAYGVFFFNQNQIIYAVRSIYMGSLSVLAVAVIVLCPILTVGTVAGDRERKIWYDLINSPLSGWSILMGKMVGRLATVFGWVLAVLPVWAILGLVGGLDPATVLKGFIATLMYGWFYAAIGLMASVLCSRTRDAVGLATGLVLLVLFSPLLSVFFQYLAFGIGTLPLTNQTLSMLLYMLNPFATITMIGLSGSPALGGFFSGDWMIVGFVSLLGPGLTLFSGLILRPVSRRLEGKTGRKNQSRPSSFPSLADESSVPVPDLFTWSDRDGFFYRLLFSPMAIKERKVRGSSRTTRIIKNFIMLIGLFFGGYFLVTAGWEAMSELRQYGFTSTNRGKRDTLSGIVMGITAVLNLVLLYSLTMDTAGRITAEKESDSWLTLLSTPVTPHEILVGKGLASLWSWRIPLGFLMACWAAGGITDSIHPVALMLTVFVWAVQMGFAIVMGIYFGSRCTSFQGVSFRAVMLWLTLQLIIPTMLSAMSSEPEFFGLMPMFVASGSLQIEEILKAKNSEAGMFLLGLIQVMTMLFSSAFLLSHCLVSFDRWNSRTLAASDELMEKAVVFESNWK